MVMSVNNKNIGKIVTLTRQSKIKNPRSGEKEHDSERQNFYEYFSARA